MQTSKEKEDRKRWAYALVHNVPKAMHSADLRDHFSDFVETSRLACFHFRHRPEIQNRSEEGKKEEERSRKDATTCCCVVAFWNVETRSDFVARYSRKAWTKNGSELGARCFVRVVRISGDEPSTSASETMSECDLQNLVELRPPAIMPQGNVGTPSAHFLEQIRLCKLPSSLISKLGLKAKRSRRQYDSVPMKYDEKEGLAAKELLRGVEKGEIPSISSQAKDRDGEDEDEEGQDDEEEEEEWDRHNALYDHVTEQGRNKERHFEEEQEVVWEKGGPGLVWHTDRNFWDDQEGTDCDWLWADDWDVDYSVYQEGRHAGTMDGRQAVEMREDVAKRDGAMEETVFRTRKEDQGRRRERAASAEPMEPRRKMKRTAGPALAEKIMQRMGWKEGAGLGKLEKGRVEPVAVEAEEKASKERSGIGYYGEKMDRNPARRPPGKRIIATRFDDLRRNETLAVEFADNEQLQRRHDAKHMKYRPAPGTEEAQTPRPFGEFPPLPDAASGAPDNRR